MSPARASAMQCLSLMARIRGPFVSMIRMQKCSACLIHSAILALQISCFAKLSAATSLEPAVDPVDASSVFAITTSWDEASQKMRSIIPNRAGLSGQPLGGSRPAQSSIVAKHTEMPVSGTTMVTLCRLHVFHNLGSMAKHQWQPWVCPLRFLGKSNANSILHSRLSKLPLNIESIIELRAISGKFGFLVLSFAFDSAAANISVYKYMAGLMESAPSNVMIHGEPCCSHQVHIIKTGCFEVAGLAATLYSTSKLLRLSSSLAGVRAGIHSVVSSACRMLREIGPRSIDGHEFLHIANLIFCIDGDSSMLHTTRDGVARPTPFLLDLQELCRRAKFDRATSEWQIFAWTAEESEESVRSRTRLPPLD